MNILLVYILICLIWGTTWFAIVVSLRDFPPFLSASLRFIVAVIMLGAILAVKRVPLVRDKKSLTLFLYVGLFSFFIPFGLVYWSEQFIPSGLSSVLFAVYPFAVAISSRIAIPEEKITVPNIAGMITGFAGIVVIFSENLNVDFSTNFLGMAAIVLSALMQSTVVVAIKKYGKHIDPLSLNFIPMLIGAVSFFAFSFIVEDYSNVQFTRTGIGAVLYLGILGTVVTFTAYYWLLKRISVIMLSLVAFITPIVALVAGWLFNNEFLSTRQVWGSVLVLTGLLINNAHYLQKQKKV